MAEDGADVRRGGGPPAVTEEADAAARAEARGVILSALGDLVKRTT